MIRQFLSSADCRLRSSQYYLKALPYTTFLTGMLTAAQGFADTPSYHPDSQKSEPGLQLPGAFDARVSAGLFTDKQAYSFPAKNGLFKKITSEDSALQGNITGSWSLKLQQGNSLHFGYSYQQLWFSDSDRWSAFRKKPFSGKSPLRSNLLEQTHRAEFESSPGPLPGFQSGLYAMGEKSYFGTRFGGSTEHPRALLHTNTWLIRPWAGYTFETFTAALYLDFFKEIKELSRKFSRQTYQRGKFPEHASHGIVLQGDLESFHTAYRLNLFRGYQRFNDPWEDFYRLGLSTGLTYYGLQSLEVSLKSGVCEDSYIQDYLMSRGVISSRKDLSFLAEVSGNYQLGSGHAVYAFYRMVHNSVRGLDGKDFTLNQGGLGWSWHMSHNIKTSGGIRMNHSHDPFLKRVNRHGIR